MIILVFTSANDGEEENVFFAYANTTSTRYIAMLYEDRDTWIRDKFEQTMSPSKEMRLGP
jgi:hypothetical protein